MHADAAGVAFYDEASDKCRIYAVDFPEAKGFVAEEIVVTPGLAIRRAWENCKPVLLNKSVPAELGLETYRLVVAEGLNGHCLIPLMSRGRPVAILIVASKAGDSFLPQDVEFLSRASGQIAIAIERKIAEEKLREDERELRRITEAIPHAIHVFGADGTLLHVNQTALDCSGLTLEDARREDYPFRIVHPDDVRRIYEWRQNLIRPDPFEYEVRLLGKDGKYRWFLIHNNPVLDEQGHIIRWYATGTDIENRKRAEEQVQNENLALREEISRSSMFEEIVGSSQPISRVLEQVVRVAPTDSTVLISGETGTGKELIARAIHKRSNRSGRAFISVNCGAIARSLIASELFGHEKGAFTGAVQRRIGRFEAAQGGTIFLDEVGELPAEAQVSLLRVLQEREFERIGSHEVLKVDVRVLAATNRDLEQAVSAGSFRSDLFYRLNVFPIEVPPLRDRASDILLLAEYMIGRYAKNAGKRFTSIGSSTLELLSNYPWPGNIRELQNVIERAVVLCDGPVFSVDETWLKLAPNRAHAPAVPVLSRQLTAKKK